MLAIREYGKERDVGTAMHYKWQSYTVSARTKLQVSQSWCPWSSEVPGIVGLPESWKRESQLLEVGWIKRISQRSWSSLAEARAGWFANISQGVQTNPFGGVKTLCSGQHGAGTPALAFI